MINPELVSTLHEGLDPVYSALAHKYHCQIETDDWQIWTEDLCEEWAALARPIADDIVSGYGGEVRHIAYDPPTLTVVQGQILPATYHEYLTADIPGMTDRLVMDGTWQQFRLNNRYRRPDLPRMMVTDTKDVDRIMLSAGIPDDIWPIWQPIQDNSIIYRHISFREDYARLRRYANSSSICKLLIDSTAKTD